MSHHLTPNSCRAQLGDRGDTQGVPSQPGQQERSSLVGSLIHTQPGETYPTEGAG